MTHEQNGPACRYDFAHFLQTPLLKLDIPHGQHFVNEQDIRLQVRSNRKGQSELHSSGIVLHRCVEEFLDTRERHNFFKLAPDLLALHSQNGTVEIDVLASGQLRMEPGADLQE